MGSKTTQQTSQQTSTPVNQAALQNIYGQVQSAAQTPYTPYGGELTAGINGQQTAGINTINSAANAAQPYYSQAGSLINSASNPLTAAQIAQYQNPYTQSVVNATQAQFNDQNGQQQNSLKGTAAQQGALGGDRQAVAQAQLAGQQQLSQAPVIANLYANSYNSGLQTAAQQYQQNPLAAASALSGLGTSAENAGLAGGSAQLAAGTQQQQTQQAADTANYQQYLAQQANPYQNAAFLEQYGLPAALGQGSTSSGTQTTQGPTNLAQIAGLGIAGAGLFLKDGGRVGYYTGGAPGYVNSQAGYVDSGAGYIPTGQASQNTLQAPQLQFMKPQSQSSTPLTGTGSFSSLGSSLKNDFGSASYGGGNMFSGDEWGGDKSNPAPGLTADDYEYKVGGLVKAIHGIHKAIRRSRGGAVSTPFQAYDDGGDVSFDDRFAPAVDNPFSDMSRGQAIRHLALQNDPALQDAAPTLPPTNPPDAVINPDNPFRMPDQPSVQAWRDGVDQPNPAIVADSGMPNAQGTAPNPMVAQSSPQGGLPPQITNPDSADEQPSSALGYASNPMTAGQPGPMGANGLPTVVAPVEKPEEQHFGHSLFGANISDKTRQALVAAGLGIMASRSPFAGVALGEGGLQGLKSYAESNKAEQEAQDKAISQANEQKRIDLQAKQIAQSAAQFAKTNSLAERREKFAEDKTPAGYRQKEDGSYEAIPGGPADPAVIKAGAEAKRTANAVLDDDTIHDMADQYLAGDRTVMQNLGRGAQGAENIVKLRQAIAQHARDQNIDPKGIVNQFNEQAGALAGQRTVGARAANISLAANEANNMIPIALEASDKLPRSQYMPWNQMVQAVQKGSSSPELASFVAATNSLVNSYVRAVSPSGVPTDSMRQHAYDMLNAAQGPDAYKAVVATMQKEMQAALSAPGQVKAELRKGNDATAAGGSGAPAAPPPVANKPATVIQNGHTYTLNPTTGKYE